MLTEKGIQRAENWVRIFEYVPFNSVYSTRTKRTLATAQPTVLEKNLKTLIYDSKNIDINQFVKNNKGKTILIVGHSNTTPRLVNALIGSEKYNDIPDDEFGNLYIVTIIDGIATSVVLKIDNN